jgi:ribosomal protein S18 acetylase RimI-like enzyme
MMGSVSFREAEESDAQSLWWTKHAAIDDIDTGEYTDDQLGAWKPDGEAVDDFETAIESSTFDAVIAEVDDDPVGYGVLNAEDGRIDAVFVHPDSMGQGIATSLVGQLESRAQMHGLEDLTIVSSLNAKSFYEKLGYRDCGTKMRTIGDEELEFAIMKKEL